MTKAAQSISKNAFKRDCASPWDGSVRSLWMGLEEEVFLLRDGAPAPLSEVRAIFSDLLGHGYHVAQSDGRGLPIQVNFEHRHGYVAIKNDYCSHILEVAFPPERDPIQFASIYLDVWNTIEHVANARGFKIVRRGYLPIEPLDIVYTSRTDWFLNRKLAPERPFADRHFGSKICAVQTHFNILNSAFFRSLPSLYSFEYLFPLLFSTSSLTTKDRTFRCVRPLVYRDNFPDTFGAVGVPDQVPTSEGDYAAFLSRSTEINRDYTFIAPRAFGSVEFRSACAQPNIDSLYELIALRIATIETARKTLSAIQSDSRELFYGVCEDLSPPTTRLKADAKLLSLATETADSPWAPHLESTLRRLSSLTEPTSGNR